MCRRATREGRVLAPDLPEQEVSGVAGYEAGEAAIHGCRVIPTPKTLARFIGRQCSLTYPHDRDEIWTQEVV